MPQFDPARLFHDFDFFFYFFFFMTRIFHDFDSPQSPLGTIGGFRAEGEVGV